MLTTIKRTVKSLFFNPKNKKKREIAIQWIKTDENSWLAQQLTKAVVKPQKSLYSDKIESLALETDRVGPQPLWSGYGSNNLRGPTRIPREVRTTRLMGNFYTNLVKKRTPQIVVEFGTAFGVSGMYFLAGLEANREGVLLTFEPNDIWAELAKKNLTQISSRFNLTMGTFEENIERCLGTDETIDIAFIDAIHTREFVIPQLNIVVERSSPKALIILDDINFSQSMKDCWAEVSTDRRFSASMVLGNRVGLLELKD